MFWSMLSINSHGRKRNTTCARKKPKSHSLPRLDCYIQRPWLSALIWRSRQNDIFVSLKRCTQKRCWLIILMKYGKNNRNRTSVLSVCDNMWRDSLSANTCKHYNVHEVFNSCVEQPALPSKFSPVNTNALPPISQLPSYWFRTW